MQMRNWENIFAIYIEESESTQSPKNQRGGGFKNFTIYLLLFVRQDWKNQYAHQ